MMGKVALVSIGATLALSGVLDITNTPTASAAVNTHRVFHVGNKSCHLHKSGHRHCGVRVKSWGHYRHYRHFWVSRKGALKHGRWHRGRHIHVRHSGGSTAWVLPRYVVMCESGGNPTVANLTPAGVANGVPSGLYQITRPTWLAYGGGRFASEARYASIYEQGVIALRVLHNQGPRAWACW
jgi:Transglycosylase-like domain